MSPAGQEVVPVPVSEYAVALRREDLLEVLSANLGDGNLTPFDLDRVKIPTGGATVWSVPSLDGDKAEKAITGVIVEWREPRVYWEAAFGSSDGATPPDCSSNDGKYGNGMYGPGSDRNPTGACSTCPQSQWGTRINEKGEPTKGQACRQMRLLFVVQPENLLPVALFLPPTSIGPLKKYFMRLSSAGVPYYGVTTKLSLSSTKGPGNVSYSVVQPEMGERLTVEERVVMREYSDQIRSALDAITLTAADVGADLNSDEPASYPEPPDPGVPPTE